MLHGGILTLYNGAERISAGAGVIPALQWTFPRAFKLQLNRLPMRQSNDRVLAAAQFAMWVFFSLSRAVSDRLGLRSGVLQDGFIA
jgi:hypothetical protein